MINWRLGSTKPGWPSSIVFMTPLTIFIVHICGSSCKSPSMSHNTPRILWSALRDNSMLISHPFHSQVRELTHTLQFYAAPLPWETFLLHEPLPRGYRLPPVVTVTSPHAWKGGGFSSSRVSVSCFSGGCPTSFRPNGSDTPSTGRHREPLGQNVFRGIGISVMDRLARWTLPGTYVQFQLFQDVFTAMTGLRRGTPLVDLHQGSSVPLCLIFQLTDELAPSHIVNRLGEAAIFDHVLDRQTLQADHLVFVNNAGRKFVLVVTTTITNTGMHTSHFDACFVAVLGSFLFPGMPALGLCQLLLILAQEARIANRFTAIENDHRFEAQVKPDNALHHGKRGKSLFNEHRDKVSARAIFADRDGTGRAVLGQRSMKVDSERGIHFCQGERRSIPGEGIGGIRGGLRVLLFLEGRIRCSSLKKVLEGGIEVSQGLLDRHARNHTQPGIRFLEIRQPC